jgi:hypothetical protein
MANMWMVRGDAGALYEEFREKGVAAIGWWQLAPHAKPSNRSWKPQQPTSNCELRLR